jgi:hypothetical protein
MAEEQTDRNRDIKYFFIFRFAVLKNEDGIHECLNLE